MCCDIGINLLEPLWWKLDVRLHWPNPRRGGRICLSLPNFIRCNHGLRANSQGHVAVSLPVLISLEREIFTIFDTIASFSLYCSFLPQHHLRLSFTLLLIIRSPLLSCLPKNLWEPVSRKWHLHLRLG